ncbi:MAG: ARMT1-like domain-containing protein, partial [Candidatus Altarchaeaceae archaeon]
DEDEKMKFLIKCAIAGNAAEYGVKGNKYMEDIEKFKENFFEILNKKFECDEAINEIKNSKKILYLADNNGEIVFDSLVINFLISLNKDITLAIKGENVMDDFSFDDLKNFKIKFDLPEEKIISCGNYVGQYFESAPKEFISELKNCDLVIAKGMANFETLDEEYKKFKIKKKTLYLLTAKCQPIADELNVERYSLVAKVI